MKESEGELLEKALKVLRHYEDVVQETVGIYKMLNKCGVVMYVGKAKNLKKRLGSYKSFAALSPRIQCMLLRIHSISFIYTDKESEALLLEARLIKQLRPAYNLLMKDDKSFTYLSMTQGLLPASIVGQQVKKLPPGDHYGPFASVKAAQSVLDTVAQTFLIRTCPDSFYRSRTEPCLQYQLKRCSAPCVDMIAQEEYARDVQNARKFLRGSTQDVFDALEAEKEAAALKENFARASLIQKRLELMKKFLSKRVSVQGYEAQSIDIIGYAAEGEFINFHIRFVQSAWDYGASQYFTVNAQELSEEDAVAHFIMQFYSNRRVPDIIAVSKLPGDLKLVHDALSIANGHQKLTILSPTSGDIKQIIDDVCASAQRDIKDRMRVRAEMEGFLSSLKEKFSIPKRIRRVELYDNSHLQMTNAFGAMVLFTPNGFEKSFYRKFSFKNPLAYRQDDATMLAEVLRRRLAMDGMDWPDMMILDGGKTQLARAIEVLEERGADIAVVAMAKQKNNKHEIFYLPDQSDPIVVDDENLLHFLQNLRDEVHRYVLACHRMRRNRQMLTSGDRASIPGIGEVRWKRLKEHFGSVDKIYEASVEDLMKVQGFNRRIAESIVYYIAKNKETSYE